MLAYTKGDAYAQAMLRAKPAEMTQAQLTALLAELRAAPELVEKLRLRTYKQLQDRVACLCDLQETILDTYPDGGCGCLRVNKSLVQLLRGWSIDVSGCRPCQGHRWLRTLEELQRAYDELYHSAKERLDYQMQAAEADHAGRAAELAAIDAADEFAARLARLKSDEPVAAPAAPDIVLPVDDDAFHADLQARLARLRSSTPSPAPTVSAAISSPPAPSFSSAPAPAVVAARGASGPPPTAAVPTALDGVIAATTARLAAYDDLDYIQATHAIETMRERRRRRGSIWSMLGIPYANPVVGWPGHHMLHAAPLMSDAAMEHLLGAMPVAADPVDLSDAVHDDFDSTQQAIAAALERGDIDEDEAGLMATALHPEPSWSLPAHSSAAAAAAAPPGEL
jgi:hypothetical protein